MAQETEKIGGFYDRIATEYAAKFSSDHEKKPNIEFQSQRIYGFAYKPVQGRLERDGQRDGKEAVSGIRDPIPAR